MPRIIISTSNDISTDNRVHKVAMLLLDLGYDVLWLGRELNSSSPLTRPYQTKRFVFRYDKGALFYASLNIRLFFYLLFAKADALLANDLDTLWPNYLVSKIRGKRLIYDTHEYFLGVPEIQNRPVVKFVWRSIERWIFPKLGKVFTVNDSIATLYENDYRKQPAVFRNISMPPEIAHWKSRAELGLPENKFIFINQGSGINVDRGMEEALDAIALVENAMLLLVGTGDVIPHLKKRVLNENLSDKVLFIDRVPYAELLQFTHASNCGITLDKDTNINYKYSLPNKLFDYIFCDIPVLSSRVIEVARIVKRFNIGTVCEDYQPKTIAAHMQKMIDCGREPFVENLENAREKMNWETEKQVLVSYYSELKKEIENGKKRS